MFPFPMPKSFVLNTHRKQVESGSEAGLVVLGGNRYSARELWGGQWGQVSAPSIPAWAVPETRGHS